MKTKDKDFLAIRRDFDILLQGWALGLKRCAKDDNLEPTFEAIKKLITIQSVEMGVGAETLR